MIKLENTEVAGWEAAIRGMRNPMNSWEKSDSYELGVDPISDKIEHIKNTYQIGPNDLDLMKKLRDAGTDHRKFMRMITVYADITAPLYWWKEFDTYKVGTVANSSSTMHKIADKEFTLEDFSHEHLMETVGIEALAPTDDGFRFVNFSNKSLLAFIVDALNYNRKNYLETKDKKYWWQMIQLLPSSYNQRRTVMLNYEVLANIYKSRKDHKLDEWHDFCHWIETLPYSEIIIGKEPVPVKYIDSDDEICEAFWKKHRELYTEPMVEKILFRRAILGNEKAISPNELTIAISDCDGPKDKHGEYIAQLEALPKQPELTLKFGNIVDILRDPSVKDVIVGFVNMSNKDAGDAAVATTMTTDRSANKFITYKIISQIFGENYDSAMMLLQDFEELRKWKKDNNIEHLIIQREV